MHCHEVSTRSGSDEVKRGDPVAIAPGIDRKVKIG